MEIFAYVLTIRILDKLYTYAYSSKELAVTAAKEYMKTRKDIHWHSQPNSRWEAKLYSDEKIGEIRIDRLQILSAIKDDKEDEEDEYI